MEQQREHQRARYVADMFARISKRYDRLNTVMSAGRHHSWRHKAAELISDNTIGPALDIATGTGDFALELARQSSVTHVTGVDFSHDMLSIAEAKSHRQKLSHRLNYLVGDAQMLPFPNNSFVCATIGFGIRNFIDVPLALKEVVRVLRPSAKVAILEIVPIDGNGLMAKVFPLYFRHITPWLGALLAGDRQAYTYLPESVEHFHSATELERLMEKSGLQITTSLKIGLGTVAIIVGKKKVIKTTE